jgi:hypothetical protein
MRTICSSFSVSLGRSGELAQFHPSVLATRVFVDKVKVKFTPSSTYFLLQPNQFHFDRIE